MMDRVQAMRADIAQAAEALSDLLDAYMERAGARPGLLGRGCGER